MAKKKKSRDAKAIMLPHSEAKVKMYTQYLEKYIKVLSRNTYINQINIIDVFCGTGIYENGKTGSPIEAFKVIKNDIETLIKEGKPTKNIRLIINDLNKENVEKIEAHIKTLVVPKTLIMGYKNYDANELIPKVIEWLKTLKKAKNLLFIDPYGYKDIHSTTLNGLLENGNTEIVLFLPISQMHRFSRSAQTDDENNSYEKLRVFINQFFEPSHPIRRGQHVNVHKYIEHIKDAFSFKEKYYTTSYYIQRDQRNYYALFFITSHIYGLEKTLETKWELDKLEGKGFQLNQRLPLGMNRLEDILKQYISKNLRTNIDLYKFVLKSEHLPSHANEILKKWKKSGRLKYYDAKGNPLNSCRSFYIKYSYFKNNEIKLQIKYIE